MRAWQDTYDDEWIEFTHAETRGKARRYFADLHGVEFTEVSPRRCPAMDDLLITTANLLATGVVAWVECPGCSRALYPAEGPVEHAFWWYDGDDWGEQEEYQPVHTTDSGEVYCTSACAEMFCARLASIALGSRRATG